MTVFTGRKEITVKKNKQKDPKTDRGGTYFFPNADRMQATIDQCDVLSTIL